MSISVIIPSYNEYENLVKLQNYLNNISIAKDTEFIIADSMYSDDNTASLGHPFTYFKTGKSGRAAQMNTAAKLAKGDILVFIHADVLPPSNFCESINKAISQGYLFGFFAYRFDPSSFMLDINASFTGRKGIFAGGGDQIHFMHKSLYETLNGYDEKYKIMEDFDFTRRVIKAKIPYTIIQDKAIVSSRKYIHNSWLRVNIANLIAFIMFKLNIDSQIIKKYYYGHLLSR